MKSKLTRDGKPFQRFEFLIYLGCKALITELYDGGGSIDIDG
jgi:hypothetical protein